MITYEDKNGYKGYVPEKNDINYISSKIKKHIVKNHNANIIVPIPTAANYLANILVKQLDDKDILLLKKKTWHNELKYLLSNTRVILIDDIICHGETIKMLIDNRINIQNIDMIIIYFYIISHNICLYNIQQKKFTLDANNDLYYLYFIKEKFMLKVPTLIYRTYNHVLMRSDVEQVGCQYKYYKNGDTLSIKEVLELI